jgi:hypothetical protein
VEKAFNLAVPGSHGHDGFIYNVEVWCDSATKIPGIGGGKQDM